MEQLEITNPMTDIVKLQSCFISSKSMKDRKLLGQFFTGEIVSNYMASLISASSNKAVRILDAGAGTGILTVSTAVQCLDIGHDKVHAVLYEIDSTAISLLRQTLGMVQQTFIEKGGTFSYEIHNEDFVVARPDKDKDILPFDISVINPPYFKYSVKDSIYSKATANLYHGDPNIYASFMAIVMACLKDRGQMIAITPRSFTNGLYFKGFRSYLLNQSSLDLIHIFRNRDKLFKNKNTAVLQENIICKFVKGEDFKDVTIRSSNCDATIYQSEESSYPKDLIIDPSNDLQFIRIPESNSEATILRQAEGLDTTFEGAGYFISTGPVVEHRTREYIVKGVGPKGSVPLYRPHNITSPLTSWTESNKKSVSFKLSKGHEKHTIINGNYVLLKRFSSKDEKRRLVSGVHLSRLHDCEFIGFGNKTNYIGVKKENLSDIEAYGLATVFNSSFMDKYFRCISGNTQVNATEIRVMKFPSRFQVKKIGKRVSQLKEYEIDKIDLIVNSVLKLRD